MARTVPDSVLSHWSTLIESFQASPLAFYAAVEAALARRQIPQTDNTRVTYKEGGLFSSEREYLRVKREKLVFDICASPFGTGFFFSWWFAEDRLKLSRIVKVAIILVELFVAAWVLYNLGFILGTLALAIMVLVALVLANEKAGQGAFNADWIQEIPVIGRIDAWLFKAGTYYRIDSMEMYQTAVHNAVLEVIDQMTTEKGLRLLGESERKPVMHRFYDRKSS
jgi:hypothetical protein